jgi:hypothetical protein
MSNVWTNCGHGKYPILPKYLSIESSSVSTYHGLNNIDCSVQSESEIADIKGEVTWISIFALFESRKDKIQISGPFPMYLWYAYSAKSAYFSFLDEISVD